MLETDLNEEIAIKQKQGRKKAALIFIVFAVVIAVISVISYSPTKKYIAKVTTPQTKVLITNTGFVPSTLVIKKGTTVVWENQTASPQVLGANPFPTHTSLSSLYTQSPIAPKATYKFTFQKQGSWEYSNYNSPTSGGSIIVR